MRFRSIDGLNGQHFYKIGISLEREQSIGSNGLEIEDIIVEESERGE
jgi:hypothetical protein